jgi:sugar/nucleoside kinase (ribokinase family)
MFYASADWSGGACHSYIRVVVDETGAGDCFAAGLIAGLLCGYPLERAARVAAACGALAVTALGATNGIASRRQVEALAPPII